MLDILLILFQGSADFTFHYVSLHNHLLIIWQHCSSPTTIGRVILALKCLNFFCIYLWHCLGENNKMMPGMIWQQGKRSEFQTCFLLLDSSCFITEPSLHGSKHIYEQKSKLTKKVRLAIRIMWLGMAGLWLPSILMIDVTFIP